MILYCTKKGVAMGLILVAVNLIALLNEIFMNVKRAKSDYD